MQPQHSYDDDEALARMLQNEMFANEVGNSPDLAHLARRRSAGRTTTTTNRQQQQAQRPALPNPFSPGGQQNIMNKIAELGDNTRKRLQLLAAQFNARNNPQHPHHPNNRDEPAPGERRGLLDDNEHDDMELAGRTPL